MVERDRRDMKADQRHQQIEIEFVHFRKLPAGLERYGDGQRAGFEAIDVDRE